MPAPTPNPFMLTATWTPDSVPAGKAATFKVVGAGGKKPYRNFYYLDPSDNKWYSFPGRKRFTALNSNLTIQAKATDSSGKNPSRPTQAYGVTVTAQATVIVIPKQSSQPTANIEQSDNVTITRRDGKPNIKMSNLAFSVINNGYRTWLGTANIVVTGDGPSTLNVIVSTKGVAIAKMTVQIIQNGAPYKIFNLDIPEVSLDRIDDSWYQATWTNVALHGLGVTNITYRGSTTPPSS
jgi:hypothetical protein